jgi:polyhydroxybutyrate depolymerase
VWRIVVLVSVAVSVVAGCARPSEEVSAGTSVRTLTFGGVERSYRLYRPAGLIGSAPLVVVLHGGFGSGEQAEKAYDWNAEADAGRFVVAYPDGLNRAWNTGGGCCGKSGRTNVDDVGFVAEVVADVGRTVPIDPARVYATGISNGGMMAYTLACRTTLFAAIGPDVATQLGDCPNPAPVSVIHIHGTADHNINYDGSPGDGIGRVDGPPVPEVNAHWRTVDNCPEPTVTTQGPVTTSIARCPGGRAVELVIIDGAGHQWPGAASTRADGLIPGIDKPSTALDATREIWRFFAAHPKP